MGFFKTVTGIQGIQDVGEAKRIKKAAAAQLKAHQNEFEQKRLYTNRQLHYYGHQKVRIMQRTLVPFVGYLERIEQKATISQMDILDPIQMAPADVEGLKTVVVGIHNILGGAATVGSMSAIAMSGVPTLITGAVATFGTASTGTVISSLSGAAASNAVLAYLGGGSLAAGGGGMAAGSAFLSTAATAAGWGVGIAAAGLTTTLIGKRALNKAEGLKTEVAEACVQMRATMDFFNALVRASQEQNYVLGQLEKRCYKVFKLFRPILADFDNRDPYHLEVFSKSMIICKTISDIAQSSLIDDDGQLSKESVKLVSDTRQQIASY